MLGIVTQGMSEKSVPGYGVLLLSGGRVLSDMYPGAFPEVPAGQIMVPGHNIPGSTYDVISPLRAQKLIVGKNWSLIFPRKPLTKTQKFDRAIV